MKYKNIIITFLAAVLICGISFAADNNTTNVTNNTTNDAVVTESTAGVITRLTVVGAPYSNLGPIQFECVTMNQGSRNKIPSRTCTLTIRYGPNNEYIDSTTYTVPDLSLGESHTYTWNTTNVNFPYNSFQTGGSYEITAVWNYPGGSATKTTSFYSVPSPWLPIFLVGIVIAIIAVGLKKKSLL
ncbi:hypothetical protein [Methanobacterium alcaliphilum]|uniref:hypothetical protein n=1 Tax=Methanobacterium alcaliphilum TaxID=392018 RepID=UPI00200B9A0B|nr:hypothetical protein [Methanobacterium alcaliphilum]MCK9151770.1 hypothetical protein [Methanobacterium alcaliphilum]